MTTPTARPLAPLSLRDLRDIDPYPAYEAMREVGSVVWDPGMAAWLVLSHDGCTYVERHEERFAEPTGLLPGAEAIVGRRDIRSLVGEQHEALHRPLSYIWRPDPVAPMARAAVRPLVADRLAGLAETGDFELYGAFARLLPIAVMARVLGLPDRDAEALDRAKGWIDAVLAWRHTYGADPELVAAAIEATKLLEPALIDTVRERRDRPTDDAISFLWTQGRAIADDWGEQDVLDNAKFLFEGGSETTAFLISTATHRLLELPTAVRAATLADRGAFMRFVEEVLRHSTVVHIRARHTVVDSVIDGVAIAAGERVIAVNAAANRDPSRWERPTEIVPERSRLFSHLAFNVGPRHCAGAHIARMEAGEAIPALFRAFPDLARPAGVDGSAVQPIGLVSRAWRPIDLVHEPVAATIARQRILDGAFRTGEAAEAGTAGGDEGPPSGRGPGGYG